MQGKKRKNGIQIALICFVVVLACTAAIAGLWLYLSAAKERDEANSALAQSRMELSIRSMAERQRRILAISQEEEERAEEERRYAVKASFLERDRAETLMLVNPWNALPGSYHPRLVDIGDDMLFDERAAGALSKMLADCRRQGIIPVPISGYRTQEYQQELFDNKVERVMMNGYTGESALIEAAKSVAVPGTSEHQLGLAMDILDVENPDLDNSQEWTPTQRWLMKHCWEYGFILRYPNGTSNITGIIYEPWHYRYVGKTVAKEITESGITLEEYLERGNLYGGK